VERGSGISNYCAAITARGDAHQGTMTSLPRQHHLMMQLVLAGKPAGKRSLWRKVLQAQNQHQHYYYLVVILLLRCIVNILLLIILLPFSFVDCSCSFDVLFLFI